MNMGLSNVKLLERELAEQGANRTQSDDSLENTVSAVMVTYHTGEVLFEAIDAVLSQDGLRDLVLVNNGNPPEVEEEIERRAAEDSRLIMLTGHGNIGFAAACNLGLEQAKGTYLLLVNPDGILPRDGLRALLAEGAGRARPWLLGCRIVNPDGSEQRGSRRESLTPWTAFVETFRIDRLAPNHPYFKRLNQHGTPGPSKTTSVALISGTCMMLPTQDYRAIAGLDEDYFLHVDDIDFCYRFREAGGEIYFVPNVQVTHYRSTSAADPVFVEWHKTRGFIRYFRKNFSGIYPPFFLFLVNAGIIGRFTFKVAALLCRRLIAGRGNERRRRSMDRRQHSTSS